MDGEVAGDRVTNMTTQEHLYKVLVIGDFGVGMTGAVALDFYTLNLDLT